MPDAVKITLRLSRLNLILSTPFTTSYHIGSSAWSNFPMIHQVSPSGTRITSFPILAVSSIKIEDFWGEIVKNFILATTLFCFSSGAFSQILLPAPPSPDSQVLNTEIEDVFQRVEFDVKTTLGTAEVLDMQGNVTNRPNKHSLNDRGLTDYNAPDHSHFNYYCKMRLFIM